MIHWYHSEIIEGIRCRLHEDVVVEMGMHFCVDGGGSELWDGKLGGMEGVAFWTEYGALWSFLTFLDARLYSHLYCRVPFRVNEFSASKFGAVAVLKATTSVI